MLGLFEVHIELKLFDREQFPFFATKRDRIIDSFFQGLYPSNGMLHKNIKRGTCPDKTAMTTDLLCNMPNCHTNNFHAATPTIIEFPLEYPN